MLLLPYERLVIKSPLRAEDALNRLNDIVEPKRTFRGWGVNTKPYEGTVEGSTFKITRILQYRNSFAPVIQGEIRSEFGGSSIQITMRPHIIVILFMLFWLGFVGLVFLGSLISFLSRSGVSETAALPGILIPGGMFIFGCVLCLGGFKAESIKSKAFFREFFQATEVEELGMGNLFKADYR